MELQQLKPNSLPAGPVWIRPVLIIIVFSLLMGWFAGTVTKPYIERGYQPSWETAEWVSSKTPAASGYYRMKLMVDALPTKAVLQVAAPDHFDIYVNGKKLAGNSFTSILTSGIYDIASLLEMGQNIIAIRVVKKTYAGSPFLIVNGYWQDFDGSAQHRIVTNTGSWRVATKQDSQARGTVSWFDKNFIDDHWDRPSPFALQGGEIIQDLTVPPEIYANFPRGKWIWNHDTFSLSGTFRRTFDLSGTHIESAWLGIATNGTYKLTINDVVMLTGSPGNSNMDTLNIGRYLKFGHNNITLDITSHQPGIRLAVAANILVDGKNIDLSSDEKWQSRSENIGDHEVWSDAFLLGSMKPIQISNEIKVKSGVLRGIPSIRIIKTVVPMATVVNELHRYFWYICGVLLVSFWLAMYCVSFIEKWLPTDKLNALEIYAIPNFVGILLIAALILIGFEIRIDPLTIYNRWTLFAIIVMILGWISLIMWEIYSKRTRQNQQSAEFGGRYL